MIAFRCHLYFCHNDQAIIDARKAVSLEPSSVVAKETLGRALYSAGQFENALVEFHKAYRARPFTVYEEWIGRCEETIKAFFAATKLDIVTVGGLLDDEESRNWRDILTITQNKVSRKGDKNIFSKDFSSQINSTYILLFFPHFIFCMQGSVKTNS